MRPEQDRGHHRAQQTWSARRRDRAGRAGWAIGTRDAIWAAEGAPIAEPSAGRARSRGVESSRYPEEREGCIDSGPVFRRAVVGDATGLDRGAEPEEVVDTVSDGVLAKGNHHRPLRA